MDEGEDRLSKIIYKGTKVAKVWKNDKIRIVSKKRNKKEKKLESETLLDIN
jgi:hypothetical protein